MNRTYRVMVGEDVRLTFEADFGLAGSPLKVKDRHTPFCVADARNSPTRAVQMLNQWLRGQGKEAWGENETWILQGAPQEEGNVPAGQGD